MRRPPRRLPIMRRRPALAKEKRNLSWKKRRRRKKKRLREVMHHLSKRTRRSELQTVRTHQMNETIYLHVSRIKFGMVMQIHCK